MLLLKSYLFQNYFMGRDCRSPRTGEWCDTHDLTRDFPIGDRDFSCVKLTMEKMTSFKNHT